MKIFEQIGDLVIDPNKPSIAIFDHGDMNKYKYCLTTVQTIEENLKDQFNFIHFGTNLNITKNYFKMNLKFVDGLKRKTDKSLPEDFNHFEYNDNMIQNSFKESFHELPEFEYILISADQQFLLPLTTYNEKDSTDYVKNRSNEFFDYLGNDPVILEDIDRTNERIIKNNFSKISPIAFSTNIQHYSFMAVKMLHDMGKLKKKVLSFLVDPIFYSPFFDKNNIPHQEYFFANDTRGTRNFKEFPIAQFQHLVYDEKMLNQNLDDWDEPEEVVQDHNFFFAGSLFHGKGDRPKLWHKFLSGITDEKSNFFIPIKKNGIIKKGAARTDAMTNKVQESFPELYEEVTNHPLFKDGVLPDKLEQVTSKYKYALIMRCVSSEDSLNFRPVLYAKQNILPFLDPMYDPDYLQIPEGIQNKLRVESAEDIERLIKYYNEHDDERQLLLKKLEHVFEIHKYSDSNFVKQKIKEVIPEFEF